MTLVVTINGRESIWLLADRRLSYEGRPTKDDARKVMFLETIDGVGILGYAGLGATARGTEPADWMSAVLCGRNYPLEQSLWALSEAMKRQLPPHMVRMPPGGVAHSVVIPAFLGEEIRLYTIDLVLTPDRKSYGFRYTRHVTNPPPLAPPLWTPRVTLGGSGGLYLHRDKKWKRGLLHLVNANDRRRVSALAVADHLATLNYAVHLGIRDKTVGPRCIVAWRHKKEGVHNGGGGHQFYTNTTRDVASPSLPTIANGMDVEAIIGAMMPHMTEMLEAMRTGQPAKELNRDAINARLARIPEKPDEELR
jgi:hypothetical protein